MDRERFEQLVAEAVESLPPEFREKLDNVAVVVEDLPSPLDARRHGRAGRTLLGLYQDQALTRRDARSGMTLPDKITIYRLNVESIAGNEAQVREEVRKTVLHEIAHHFGIDDARLHDLGY